MFKDVSLSFEQRWENERTLFVQQREADVKPEKLKDF